MAKVEDNYVIQKALQAEIARLKLIIMDLQAEVDSYRATLINEALDKLEEEKNEHNRVEKSHRDTRN